MARYESMANGSSVDWDERKKAYARNLLAINYPSTSNDYKLNIDKILNKDDTEYANLCTFLGVSGLSSTTWKTYVDSYLTSYCLIVYFFIMKLSDFIQTKDFIECVESYPFAIRNLLTEAKQYHITRHSGQRVDYQIDLELTTMENVGTIHTSNVNAPMTGWKMHEISETYKWISDRACEIANDLSKKMAKVKFKTIDCWGVYYRDNDYTKRHSHWIHASMRLLII